MSASGCAGTRSRTPAANTRVRVRAITEQIRELPAGLGLTGRLRRSVAVAVGAGEAVSVAGEGLMSWPIAHAAFVPHADKLVLSQPPVLGPCASG